MLVISMLQFRWKHCICRIYVHPIWFDLGTKLLWIQSFGWGSSSWIDVSGCRRSLVSSSSWVMQDSASSDVMSRGWTMERNSWMSWMYWSRVNFDCWSRNTSMMMNNDSWSASLNWFGSSSWLLAGARRWALGWLGRRRHADSHGGTGRNDTLVDDCDATFAWGDGDSLNAFGTLGSKWIVVNFDKGTVLIDKCRVGCLQRRNAQRFAHWCGSGRY